MEVIYSRACGVDLHKPLLQLSVSLIPPSSSIFAIDSQPSTTSSSNLKTGSLKTAVSMYAWKVPTSIISLYTIHWKVLFPMSSFPILNELRLLKVRKMTVRMPNGFLIFSSLVLSDPALSLKRIFAFLKSLPDISLSSSIPVLLRRIVSRMRLLLETVKLIWSFLISLVNLLSPLSILFYQMMTILTRIFFPKSIEVVKFLPKISSVLLMGLILILIRKQELKLLKKYGIC